MPYKTGDYYEAIDKIASFAEAEQFDNAGLIVGSPESAVASALIALDVTADVIAEAKGLNANLIITHHPVIFPHLNHIDESHPVYRLISLGINVISAHTNLDKADIGVNGALAKVLGLSDIKAAESGELPGLARIGRLPKAMAPDQFAVFVKQRLNARSVKYTHGKDISVVAACGGSGGDLWHSALESGADALVTSEVKHHQFIGAKSAGFTLVDAGHYATEVIALGAFGDRLRELLPGADILISQSQSDPANYA